MNVTEGEILFIKGLVIISFKVRKYLNRKIHLNFIFFIITLKPSISDIGYLMGNIIELTLPPLPIRTLFLNTSTDISTASTVFRRSWQRIEN